MLVAAVERWAAENGCVELASDCTADNEGSFAFHRRVGFEVAKRLVHFRRDISTVEGN